MTISLPVGIFEATKKMKPLPTIFRAYVSDDSGATAIEYGLIAALVGVSIIGGAQAMSGSINGLFSGVDSKIDTVL